MASEAFAVVIRYHPDAREAKELLEFVLAGASLELDIDVLLEGRAVAFLGDEAAGQWQQLLDHGLARLWFCGDWNGFSSQKVEARPIASKAWGRMLETRTLVEL